MFYRTASVLGLQFIGGENSSFQVKIERGRSGHERKIT